MKEVAVPATVAMVAHAVVPCLRRSTFCDVYGRSVAAFRTHATSTLFVAT